MGAMTKRNGSRGEISSDASRPRPMGRVETSSSPPSTSLLLPFPVVVYGPLAKRLRLFWSRAASTLGSIFLCDCSHIEGKTEAWTGSWGGVTLCLPVCRVSCVAVLMCREESIERGRGIRLTCLWKLHVITVRMIGISRSGRQLTQQKTAFDNQEQCIELEII